MKNIISLSPRCAAHSRRSMIILVGQLVSVDLGMPKLGYCATPVVPELGGGKGRRKPPRSSRRSPRLDPHTPSCEIIADPLVAALHLAHASPSLRGGGKNTIATNGYRMSLLPSRLFCPGRLRHVFGTGCSVKCRMYPPLVVYAANGTSWAMCSAITLAHRPSHPSVDSGYR
jgi:hypothetical protein